MKRWKKIVLVLLVLVFISQLPFAYRRYKLRRLRAAIEQLESQRVTDIAGNFVEYLGVIHVHSFLGGHSTGTFEEIIAGAQANNLSFVVMTEHPARNFDTAAMTLKGIHGGVLFVNGNEVVTASQDRLLVLPGDEAAAGAGNFSTDEFASQQKQKGALELVAYPQEFKSWTANGYDGVEIYNLFTNSRRINPVVMFFDGLWSYRKYPDLLFANFYQRPSQNLKLWDEALAAGGRRLVATAGNDAHANVGLALEDSAGKRLFGIKLDPYERSFRLVRMHVQLPKEMELTTESLLAALRDGHCFIAFDLFGDATGFRFSADNGSEKKNQGDEITLSGSTRLAVHTPLSSRVVLFKNGNALEEQSGAVTIEFPVSEKGIYRVEVYLPQLPSPAGAQPWIISNPIYVR
ncbi:MAG: hypothetical protein JWM21_4435 [Acidobacteria bacterium]|nr:hypothetical protein [Acidobacteriota bacterium]